MLYTTRMAGPGANLAEALALYFEDEADDLGVGEAPIIAPVEVDVGG